MKKILLFSLLFSCFYLMNIKAYAQIGYQFNSAQSTNMKSGDLKAVVSNLKTFTYEFWANRINVNGSTIFSNIITGDIVTGGFGVNSNRMIVSLSSDFGGITQSITIPGNTANVWHHYAYVFDNGNWSFYFDGVSIGSNVPDDDALLQTPPYSTYGPTFFNAGNTPTGELPNFNGLLDEIRIWNVARNPTEILTSKNNELIGIPTGLVAYYKLNEQTGQVVIDNGPNGLNGVLGKTSAVESIDPVINQPAKVTGYPASATISATAITAATVTLNGTLHDNGNATTATFDYGTSPTLAGSSSVAATPSSINVGAGTTVITAGLTGLNSSTTYYFRAKGVNSAGPTTGDILNFTTSIVQPSLNIVSSITAPFVTTYGTASASQSFTVSGANLNAAVLITPPAGGFELSTNNTDFSPTLTIGAAGTLATTTVYMRLAAGNPVSAGTFGGNIQLSTSGITNNPIISLLPTNAINKAPLTITANSQTKVYGNFLPSLTASYTGFMNGDTPISLTTPPTLTTTATITSSVAGSPYAINATGAVSANYTISYVSGSLTVAPVSLTITAVNKTKAYGAAVPTLTASYTGFVNGETPLSLTSRPTLTTTATTVSPVAGSPYAITASGAVSANYAITYVAGNLSVMPTALTITLANKTKVYGAAIPELSATYSGFVNGDTPISLTTLPTLSTTATTASSVAGSPYAITATGAAGSNYTIGYVLGSLTVSPAPLTITLNDQIKIYGAPVPLLSGSYSGFVNGDTQASLTKQPTLTTTATAASSVAGSPYAITASGGAAANYTISYAPGNLSVTGAPLIITVQNKTKVYGAAVPALTASYSGFVNGDVAASLTTFPTLTTPATAASSVPGSPYAITASDAAAANYTISYVPGILSVTPASLTIIANSTTKSYGAAAPALLASYSGFVNGDTPISLTTLPTLTTTATAASSVAGNPYAITASGAVSANYTIAYTPGNLSVTAVPLTITADNQTKAYSAPLPALTASYSGLVNGDTPASFIIPPTLTTTATANSSIAGGPYAITVSGAVNANYMITYVPGSLSVVPAILTITAANKTKVYGAAVPILTVSYSGFINGDTPASLTTQPTLTTAATAASSVASGPYVINVSGAVNSNYTINYVTGSLSVTPAPLSVTVNNQTKAYGAALPVLTTSYSGLVNGDTPASLTTPATLTTSATAASSVAGSPYTITANGAVSTNYTITYAPGDLSVTTALLTITANNQNNIYGAALPVLTTSYSGFVNGDTDASLTNAPVLTTTATAASSVAGSPYAITASGAVNPNYTISYIAGNLAITAAPLIITADNQNKAYGAALPVLTASYSGFVNGDTQASLTTQPVLTTTATTASSVAGSPYAITATGAANPNYTISYVAGNLTIGTKAITVTAYAKSKTYGDTDPAFTYSLTGALVGSDTFTGTLTRATGENVNTYAINQGTLELNTNYALTYVPANLTIGTKAITVTADAKSKTYGDIDPAFTYTLNGTLVGSDTFTGTLSRTTGENVNTYAINQGTLALNTNYALTYVPANLTIGTKAITITADAKSKTYEDIDPAFTYTLTGALVGTDSFTGTLTRVTGENVNTYAINQGTLALNTNYALTYVPANLTIGTKAITITADAKSKTYGDTDPAFTYTLTGALISNDSFTGTLSRATGENVNTYPINQGTLALNNNYALTYVPANLTIGTKAITITADAKRKTYGTDDPTFTYTLTGALISNDSFTGTLSRATGENVNTYAINQGTLALNNNYALTYVPANLTIGTKAITVTADAKSKTYGTDDPTFTYTLTGALISNDSFTGTLFRVTGENVNTYAINQGTLALNTNYALTYVPANLTIGTKAITVTADAKSKTYGTADPAFTYSLTGALVGSDTFTGTLTRATGENVNTYAINQGTLALNNNYVLTYVPANLTIGTKAITVTADAKGKAYGTADPAFTYTISSGTLVGNDTFTGKLTRLPGESVNSYAITQGTLALNSNYVLSYTGANLFITRKILTITANNQRKVYGSANPALTVSYSGFLNGDNQSILTAQPVISTTATTASGVNTYPITISGAATADYEIAYVPGTLTVNKAALTVTADNKSRRYGLSNPEFTLSYSGFVNGDNAAALAVQPVATSIASTTSTPGNYPITVNGAASANYNFSYVKGTLTVISINSTTVSSLTISSGTLSPAFTPETRSYKATVDNLSRDISFTITTDPTATVTINGSAASNGTPSPGIPLNAGNNTITIVVRAQDGITTNIYTVTVYKGQPAATITATNILSPNGDGKNDNWVIQDIQLYPKNTVNIFDRAGRIVYSKQGYNNEWDGTLKGAPLAQGTYFYTVDLGPGLPKIKGFITLLKGN